MGATGWSGPLSSGGVPLLGGVVTQVGNVYWCDPGGLMPSVYRDGLGETYFTTLADAYAACTAGQGDTVYLYGGISATSQTAQTARLSATFEWAKNATNLIGVCASTQVGQRARISTASTATKTFSPLVLLSASDCTFANLSIFDDCTTDPCALKITGQRIRLDNVNVQGMGAAGGSADANGSSLWIAAGAEITITNSTIGLDTVARSAANGEIRFTAAATRIIFDNCRIVSETSLATHVFVKAANSGDIDRYIEFNNCRFLNAPTGISGGLTMDAAFSLHASAGGYVSLNGCTIIGCTDVAAADNGNVFGGDAAPTAGTSELAVAVTQ